MSQMCCPACHVEHNGNYEYCDNCFQGTPGYGRKKMNKLRTKSNQKTVEEIKLLNENLESLGRELRRITALVSKNNLISERKHNESSSTLNYLKSKVEDIEANVDSITRQESKKQTRDSSDYDSSDDELEEENYLREQNNDIIIERADISWKDTPNISPIIKDKMLKHQKELFSEDDKNPNYMTNKEIRDDVLSQYLDIPDEKHIVPIRYYGHIETPDDVKFIDFDLKKITPSLKGKKLNKKIHTFLCDVNKSNFEEKFNKIFKKACKSQYNLMKQYDEDNYYH